MATTTINTTQRMNEYLRQLGSLNDIPRTTSQTEPYITVTSSPYHSFGSYRYMTMDEPSQSPNMNGGWFESFGLTEPTLRPPIKKKKGPKMNKVYKII